MRYTIKTILLHNHTCINNLMYLCFSLNFSVFQKTYFVFIPYEESYRLEPRIRQLCRD